MSGDGGRHPTPFGPKIFYPNGRERVPRPRPDAAAARRLAVVASAWPRLPGAAVQRRHRLAGHGLLPATETGSGRIRACRAVPSDVMKERASAPSSHHLICHWLRILFDQTGYKELAPSVAIGEGLLSPLS